ADAFDASHTVNVRAPFLLTQQALPLLNDGGRIINITSAVTRIASPFVHYAMNKAALETMAHTLANLLGARRITVNSVAPGTLDTDMGSWVKSAPGLEASVVSSIVFGRLGNPDDIAEIVAFLASEAAGWITGATIDATGGQWLGPRTAGRSTPDRAVALMRASSSHVEERSAMPEATGTAQWTGDTPTGSGTLR